VDAWHASGLPLQTFAREQGLPSWRVRWWAQKLGRLGPAKVNEQKHSDASDKHAGTSQAIHFVPAVLTGTPASTDDEIVIRLPDGIEIAMVGATARFDQVAHLVAQLRRAER